MDKAKPAFVEDKPVIVFDLWEGANFKLRVKNVDGYPNYDQSFFEGQSELLGGDENKLIEVINKQHPLKELLDPKHFKSYEELSRKLQAVINPNQSETPSAVQMTQSYAAPEPKSAPVYETKAPVASSPFESGNDEDIMNYFQNLSNEL